MNPSGHQNQAQMPKIEFPDTDSQMLAHYIFQKRIGLSNMIERELGVSFVRTGLKDAEVIEEVSFRGDPQNKNFRGHAESERMIKKLFSELCAESKGGSHLDKRRIIHLAASIQKEEQHIEKKRSEAAHGKDSNAAKQSLSYIFKARTLNQQILWDTVDFNDVTFGEGPAGTGKTHVAIAKGALALINDEYERLYLSRPARSSGKDFGALPGGLNEKLSPYLVPLYDELEVVLGGSKLTKLLAEKRIEVVPLEFIQGRTLKNSFIVLDEAQNTQNDQMELFLTRLGLGSKMVVLGSDQQVIQTDGRHPPLTGMKHAVNVLEGKPGIGLVRFTSKDVVRHGTVKTIVEAFEKAAASFRQSPEQDRRLTAPMGSVARLNDFKRGR